MPLVTYRDLIAFSKSDPGIQVGKLALQRFRNAGAPMPPYPEAPLTAAELGAWESWVNENLEPRWRGARDECDGVTSMPTACDAPTQVFQPLCASAGCHNSNAPAGGLDLLSPNLMARLDGAVSQSALCNGSLLVSRAAPDSSLMIQKLNGTATCGVRMPVAPLTIQQSQVDCVRSWMTDM